MIPATCLHFCDGPLHTLICGASALSLRRCLHGTAYLALIQCHWSQSINQYHIPSGVRSRASWMTCQTSWLEFSTPFQAFVRQHAGTCFVQVKVACTQDVLNVMEIGQRNRSVAETKMNERSSRSHSVLTIIVDGLNNVTGIRTHGCLHLIDLAGKPHIPAAHANT